MLDAGDDLLRVVEFTGVLPSGGSYDRLVNVHLSDVPGDYYLLVKTDGGDVLVESSESDNIGVSAQSSVAARFRATLSASVSEAISGQVIQLSGQALDAVSGAGMAFEFVTIEAELDGAAHQLSQLELVSAQLLAMKEKVEAQNASVVAAPSTSWCVVSVSLMDVAGLVLWKVSPGCRSGSVAYGSLISSTSGGLEGRGGGSMGEAGRHHGSTTPSADRP